MMAAHYTTWFVIMLLVMLTGEKLRENVDVERMGEKTTSNILATLIIITSGFGVGYTKYIVFNKNKNMSHTFGYDVAVNDCDCAISRGV